MKRAVSISIGSSRRNKAVEIELMGERIRLERIGTDGDMQKAAELYRELDGKVDAFGVGGADLGLMVDKRWYRLHSVKSLVRDVRRTPVVDGTGLKNAYEYRAAALVDANLPVGNRVRRAFITSGVDRFGMTLGLVDAGYETVIGDLMFVLGLPIPIHTIAGLKRVASVLVPVVSHLPFHWLYPTGASQDVRKPRFIKYFNWSTLVAGDCHFITYNMPDALPGRIIITNTTTEEDRALFRRAGVKYLVTTTPVIEGRSFGTNLLEAAMVALMGRTQPVDYTNPGSYFQDIDRMIDQLGLAPQFQEL
ncbi:MAG: hypothetical protein ROW39_07170 [Anaerolineaceae bacterium]|jgi:hypothetical protein